MRDSGGGGAVSFSRVYQALESGSISDFTRGKSKPSAAVDSGGVSPLIPTGLPKSLFSHSLSLSLFLILFLHLSLSV